jgi:hypothetical protein
MKNYNKNIKDKEQKVLNYYNKLNVSTSKPLQKSKTVKRTRKNLPNQKGGVIKETTELHEATLNASANHHNNHNNNEPVVLNYQSKNNNASNQHDIRKETKLTLKNSDFVVWD